MTLLLFYRAQDQASMQLSEMEEEMDQRIHAAERKTREQVGHVHIHTLHIKVGEPPKKQRLSVNMTF